MAKLTEQLISEFVQTTTPKTDDRNHEFTVTGTVISIGENGVVNVRMDGGEEAPCQSTVGCTVDDRVIVSFKNREPVVTSNITSPTTSVAQLNAEVANINTVMAQKATITQLNTEVANINNVVAQKATITQLNTEVANINNVVAQKATITYVDSKTVSAVNVFAQNGTFSGTLSVKNSSVGSNVVIGQTGQAAIMITDQSSTWYNNNYIMMNTGYVTASRGSNTYTTLSYSGVESSNGSRLISSSEISTLSNLAGWINRGAFTGNLNSTTISPGFYRLGAADSYSGTKPSPAPTYCLFFQSPAYHTQVIIDAAGDGEYIAFRDYTGSPASWRSWRKLTAT